MATSTDPAVHRALAAAHRAGGNELDARVEESAAAALEAGQPWLIYNLATVYFMAGYRAEAETWYELTLAVDPDLADARRNLATILFDDGRKDEARAHWHRAYSRKCVYVTDAVQERRRVLILAASGYGNIPVKFLLQQHFYTQVQLLIAYATPDILAALPRYDVVLNAIGDPDVEGPTEARVQAFLASCKTAVLNRPECVSLTRRDRLPARLGGIPGVELPPVMRVHDIDAAVAVMDHTRWAFPLLLRPAASHGGEGLVRVDGPEGLGIIGGQTADAWYLCPFVNYRSGDGLWRKYRMIFVDRQPYPYHLAISDHWLVHYVTADMLSDPAKCAEERRFLDDPHIVLGDAGMAAIRAIGRRLDLDYAGVDFTILPGGQLLVFEANATMLVHPETQPAFAYKNPPVHRILEAFQALVMRRDTPPG